MLVKKIFHHRLFQAGLLVTVGSMVVNVLNYLFNLLMGRLLGPESFGELAALFSLLIITSVPATMVSTLMNKFASEYQARGELCAFSTLYVRIMRYTLIGGGLLTLILWLLIPLLSDFLHVHQEQLIVFSFLLPVTLVGAVMTGTLQGLHLFTHAQVSSIVSTLFKLLLSVGAVWLGYSVSGVLGGVLVGSIVGIMYAYVRVRPYLVSQKQPFASTSTGIKTEELWRYVWLITVTTLLLALISNIDVILAKHFLPPETAGHYSALTLAGKVITYGAGAFIAVMFPMVSAASVEGKDAQEKLLRMSLLLSGSIGLVVVGLFTLFPGLFIRILFGVEYLDITPFLTWIGLASFCGMISAGLINYFMAVRESLYVYAFAAVVVCQIVLLTLFHRDIQQLAAIALSVNVALMILLFATFFYTSRRETTTNE